MVVYAPVYAGTGFDLDQSPIKNPVLNYDTDYFNVDGQFRYNPSKGTIELYHDGDNVDFLDRSFHTGSQLSATISDFDTQVRTSPLNLMATPTANFSLGGYVITGSGAGNGTNDLVTKGYVDGLFQGMVPKGTVRVATTANITLSGLQTIDGITGIVDDKVLVKNQDAGYENGLYYMKSGDWVRTENFDSSEDAKPGSYVIVLEGTVNHDITYFVSNDSPITLGVTVIVWSLFSRLGDYVDGVALLRTGNVFDVRFDDTTIGVSSDLLYVKNGGIGTTQLANDSVDKTKINADIAGTGIFQNVDGSLEIIPDDVTVALNGSQYISLKNTVAWSAGSVTLSPPDSFTLDSVGAITIKTRTNILFDIDNDNNSTTVDFKITKDNGAKDLFRIQENGTITINGPIVPGTPAVGVDIPYIGSSESPMGDSFFSNLYIFDTANSDTTTLRIENENNNGGLGFNIIVSDNDTLPYINIGSTSDTDINIIRNNGGFAKITQYTFEPYFDNQTSLGTYSKRWDEIHTTELGINLSSAPAHAIHLADGNFFIEGGGETAFIMKRYLVTPGTLSGTGVSTNPIFSFGRISEAGDDDPEMKFIFTCDELYPVERVIMKVDRKGIIASVKYEEGSHFEGFVEGEVEPMFRLSSYNGAGRGMTLELGAGDGDVTDVFLRRLGAENFGILLGSDKKLDISATDTVISNNVTLGDISGYTNAIYSLYADNIISNGNMYITDFQSLEGFVSAGASTRFHIRGPNLGTTAGNTSKIASFGMTASNEVTFTITGRRISNGSDWTTSALDLCMNVDATDRPYVTFSPYGIGVIEPNPSGIFQVSSPSGTTTQDISVVYSNASSSASRRLFLIHNDNSAATGVIPFQITNDARVDTIFTPLMKTGNVTWYESDGTTPNGNLTASAHDLCIGADSGKIYRCSGTNVWVEIG